MNRRPRSALGLPTVALAVILLAVAVVWGLRERAAGPALAPVPPPPSAAGAPAAGRAGAAPQPAAPASAAQQGFLYGRVTTPSNAVYQGRLRFGGDEEAFWTDAFKGRKAENPWAALVPPEQLVEKAPFALFGIEILARERQVELSRPFMARFGDVSSIEAAGRVITVTLSNGSVNELDRFSADDLMDGLRVWDAEQGVVDLEERSLRRIDFLPTAVLDEAPVRLRGRVRTEQGDFSGTITWDWGKTLGSDTLGGRSADGERSIAFEEIRSIERDADDAARVTLMSGEALTLSGSRQTGEGNRGVTVDDPRYGRVLIGWHVFRRVDFDPDARDSGPAYADFPPGEALRGRVSTREGPALEGRLVFDLDESETTETLDAPDGGVHYTIPFGLVSAVALDSGADGRGERALVTLHGAEALALDRDGDLGDENGGLLVFQDDLEAPQYLPWSGVRRIDFERPERMYPPMPLE